MAVAERQACQLLPAPRATELRFDVLSFSMVFEKGHKIRLVLAFADTATPKLSPVPTVSVYRDATHASSITLPIIE